MPRPNHQNFHDLIPLVSFSIPPPKGHMIRTYFVWNIDPFPENSSSPDLAPGTHHLAPGTRGRHLELVAPFGKLCEALLNVAINLRQEREIRLFGWFPETTHSKVVDDDY